MARNLFPERIKARRKELGLSLRDVSRITHGRVSNPYLSQIENGKVDSPGVFILLDLAATYALDIGTMIDWLGMPSDIKPPPLCPTCGRAMVKT